MSNTASFQHDQSFRDDFLRIKAPMRHRTIPVKYVVVFAIMVLLVYAVLLANNVPTVSTP